MQSQTALQSNDFFKYFLTSFLLTFALLFTVSCSDSNDPDDDNNGNGKPSEIEFVWKNKITSTINPFGTSNEQPTIDENDNIYILSLAQTAGNFFNHGLTAFDRDGKLLWSKPDLGEHSRRDYVSYYDNKLYYATNDKLVCLNASNGNQLWEFVQADSLFDISPNFAVANGNVYAIMEKLGAEYTYLFAIDASTGQFKSQVGLSQEREVMNIAVKGNLAYVTGYHLYSVNLSTMEINWTATLPKNSDNDYVYSNFYNMIAIAPNGNVVFAYQYEYDVTMKYLVSYNSAGQLLWEKEKEWLKPYVAIDGNGSVYISDDDELYKLNGETGAEIWSAEPPSMFLGSYQAMIIANNGQLYCGDLWGIYRLDQATGKAKWIVPVSDFIESGMGNLSHITLLSNGNIVGLSADVSGGPANIYCIKDDSNGISTQGWAKWGGSGTNSFSVK